MILKSWHRLCLIALVLPFCALALSAWAQEDGETDDGAVDETEQRVDYDVLINVPDSDGLRSLIEASSQLILLSDDPPASVNGLILRADADMDRFETVMKSRGYYDSDINYQINTDVSPVVVDVSIAPGEQYIVAEYDIAYANGAPAYEAARPTLDDIGVTIGEAALADAVVGSESQAVRFLRDHGYPFATADDRLVLADHLDMALWIQVTITPGPFVRFGEVHVGGLDRTESVYLARRVPWQKGDVYNQSLVDKLRQDLTDSGLFSSVRIQPDEETDAEERSILVSIEEGPPRTVRAGASFSTEDGFEVRFGWQHRNLYGEAELLDISTRLGLVRQRVDATYRQPDFRKFEQDLVINGALLNEELEAFQQTGATSSAAVEWPVSEHWRGSMGVALEFLQITEEQRGNDEQLVLLFGLPVSYYYDDTDNLLNPTEGFRLLLGTTPWTGQVGPIFNTVSTRVGSVETDDRAAVSFVSSQIAASTYYAFDDDSNYVVAFRSRVASVGGEPTQTLPANHRLYAGGAGSVRGYEFQTVGPLDADNKPLGGRSLLTVGAELRLRVIGDVGVVPFIDGGMVYDSTVPDFSEELFWGAGLGLRYYTDFGPLRLDVAVPLDRRPNIDDPYQFYISLGQAF